MKVFVKNLVTNEFLTHAGTWTADLAQARDFKSSIVAITFCEVHALSDFQLAAELPQRGLHLLPYARASIHDEQLLSDY